MKINISFCVRNQTTAQTKRWFIFGTFAIVMPFESVNCNQSMGLVKVKSIHSRQV
jgi:hypothetical protein